MSIRGAFFDWKDSSEGTPSGVNLSHAIVQLSGVLDPEQETRSVFSNSAPDGPLIVPHSKRRKQSV